MAGVTRRGSTASRAGEDVACRSYVGIVSPGDSQCARETIVELMWRPCCLPKREFVLEFVLDVNTCENDD
jgi:hypothetical protein